MKKPVTLFLTAFLITLVSRSQLRIAIAGGIHSSSVMESNNLPDWSQTKNAYSSRTGAHFGFLADLQFIHTSRFYFQPGILFYNKGRKFFNTYDTSVYEYSSLDAKQFINYIEAPLNILYKLPVGNKTKIFFGGGPYLSFFYNGKESSEKFLKTGTVKTDENNDLPVGDGPGKYSTFDFGASAVAGVEFGNVFIAGNFSRGLKDFYSAASYNGQFKHQVTGVTLGVFIGKAVSIVPPPKDQDQDGIPDPEDQCPAEPGSLATNGCPDSDGDGLADRVDGCPGEKGPVANNGCPWGDKDGDGVTDDKDQCVDIPGTLKYNGCPVPDTDKDGLNDEEDKCKDVPGLERYGGCPIPDSDGDGVNDEDDKCVYTAGLKENNGCPEIKKEVVEKVEYAARRIQFEFAKATLRKESEDVLDQVVEILKNDGNLKLHIEGHTSSDGDFGANMRLSRERADAVKNYMISRGIDPSRLVAEGFGPTRPLNEGKTEQEKALNRRVEMKPDYQ